MKLSALTGAALCLSFSLLGISSKAAPPSKTNANLFAGASWVLLTPKGAAVLKTTPASGASPLLEVTVSHPVNPYYQIQLTHDIAATLPAGKRLRYEFWARSQTYSPIHAVIEKRTAPYTRVMDHAITLTPAWKHYAFTAPVPAAFGPRGLAARLQLGEKAGTMEFKDLTAAAGAR